MHKILGVSLQAIFYLCLAQSAESALLEDIGYTALADRLGSSLPTGERASIDQTEASTAPEGELPVYLADDTLPSFPNTEIVDQSGINSTEFSSHANSVAQRLAGTSNSQLPNLMRIDAYEASHWITSVLRPFSVAPPVSGTGRIANHSWRGNAGNSGDNLEFLRRLDWLVAEDDYFQAIGAASVSSSLLFAHAMNGVVVKNTASTTNMATTPLDDVYQAGRPAIHLVVPDTSPSNATGVVASSASLLTQIFNSLALSPELLKAVLMAGAVRETQNQANGDIQNYGAQLTSNGLDFRYGAGQLNVLNSYEILAAGISPAGQGTTDSGFDFVENFGSLNQTASYPISIAESGKLHVTLAWNLDLNTSAFPFDPDPNLYDLNLALYDVTDGGETLISSSNSPIDNTENLMINLQAFRQYELRVSHQQQSGFSWPYAIAWRISITEDQESPAYPVPFLHGILVAALVFIVGTIAWVRLDV